MIFQSMKLYNFRQYKLEHKFDFSDSKQKNITLIIGDNGAGKTTFLQAFRYCFYGSSSNYLNLPRSNELINFTISDNLKELEVTTVFVEVEFKHKTNSYLVKREQK
jgi:DNA sulfur modification protein DndD